MKEQKTKNKINCYSINKHHILQSLKRQNVTETFLERSKVKAKETIKEVRTSYELGGNIYKPFIW